MVHSACLVACLSVREQQGWIFHELIPTLEEAFGFRSCLRVSHTPAS